MNGRRVIWQLCIAFLIAIALFYTAASFASVRDSGDFGFALGFSGGPHVTAVTPGSPAAKAGIKTGDRMYFDRNEHNMTMAFSPRPGEQLTFHLGAPDGRLVSLVAQESPLPPLAVLIFITLTRFAFLLIGGVVAWRRSGDPAARALATFLAAYGTGLSIDVNVFADPNLRFVAYVLTEASYVLGTSAVLLFACRFPPPPSGGLRARLARWVPAIGAAGLTLSIVRLFLTFVFGDPGVTRPLITAFVVWYASVVVAALAVFVASFRRASGADRVRMQWILTTFVVGFSGLIPVLVGAGAGYNPPWLQLFGLTVLLIPIGLGYTILRHRVLDIGFVVNRAVVYTGVSFVVVGGFIAFEWLLGHLVEQGSRTSVAIQLGGALVLGLSVRYIHNRVDRYVDDVFFRERHLAEAAVRRFAQEAALITSPDELVEKTVEVAQQRLRLSGCAFYSVQGDSYAPLHSTIVQAPAVGENDYAVLEMRTWRSVVEPGERGSALPGELALPMVVRGALRGFLLCGAKLTHEAIAPDERDALAVLARDAGIALDSLRIRIVERELAFLAGDGDLPAGVRARLRAVLERPGDA